MKNSTLQRRAVDSITNMAAIWIECIKNCGNPNERTLRFVASRAFWVDEV